MTAPVEDLAGLRRIAPLRSISTWSLAILAAIAIGFVLFIAREVLLPIVAAFVVGVMLSPAARRLEAFRAPRPLAALLLVSGVILTVGVVIALRVTVGATVSTMNVRDALVPVFPAASTWLATAL